VSRVTSKLQVTLPKALAKQYGIVSWFDAHLWAYAEHYACSTLLSEDFQHDRQYGTVRVVNPFLG
jgi:predicted nucleic acid-binding protein